MTGDVLFSDDTIPFDWSEAEANRIYYGTKGARLAALPRKWTPPFILVPASVFAGGDPGDEFVALGDSFVSRVETLSGHNALIVRSSVVGESIWDRGAYKSVVVSGGNAGFVEHLKEACLQVLKSASGKQVALVIQRHVSSPTRGQFGNLLRISKTRDHWELSTESSDGGTSRARINTQRDEAASPAHELALKPGLVRERLFGSIGAWLNNSLTRGRSQRLNCEWVIDGQRLFLVQVDEEDEDFLGVNPYQIRVVPAHPNSASDGSFLKQAAGQALQAWDKLKVLEQLWEPNASHKPTLFYARLCDLPSEKDTAARQRLANDFASLIGPDNIIVRTSVRAGAEKLPNLPHTEGVQPRDAASWCLAKRDEFGRQGADLKQLAFVAHRFIAARASAWVRAEPRQPIVDIHGLWGLPDALQYCPYDIWEVHLPTEVVTDYPEYKSSMLIARDDGGWELVRIKNEFARNLCIARREVLDLATRTLAIANRIGRPCHVMWFVGCVDDKGERFSIPWYWTEAHDAEKNLDRSNYKIFTISNPSDLSTFEALGGSRSRQAIELKPTTLDLMRDTQFIEKVGTVAKAANVPVLLAGSTLAHAYYQLRRQHCTVVTRGEKDHSRIRRGTTLGKLVRDKIPARIVQRQEAEITKKVPNELIKGYLTSKLIEEAMEVRGAEGIEQKTLELADVYEVVRALAKAEKISLEDVVANADRKKERSGGFDGGLVLLQTGIVADGSGIQDSDRPLTQVLARKVSGDSYEIPFTFFGFMEFDQVRSLIFDDLGIRLDMTLKSDRIELHLSREAEQLELPLDISILAEDDTGPAGVVRPTAKGEKRVKRRARPATKAVGQKYRKVEPKKKSTKKQGAKRVGRVGPRRRR